MAKNRKILLCIAVIIIVAGIIVTAVFGLNKGMDYSASKQVKIYLATDVDINKIREITDEVFGTQKVVLQKVELFNDEISITTKDITEEQLSKLVQLTNKEYNLDNKTSDLEVVTISGANIMDTIYPYFLPIIISLVIILVYIGIKYKKQGPVKVILTTLGWSVLVEAIYYSIIAISRMPINRYTMPIGLAILLITLTTIIYKFENKVK